GTGYSGVFKSTDGGISWTAVNSGMLPDGNNYIVSMAMDPLDSSTIYLGQIDAGVFKTTNAGTSWTASNAGMAATLIGPVAVGHVTSPVAYTGTNGGGLFKTSNSGGSW